MQSLYKNIEYKLIALDIIMVIYMLYIRPR